jgi:hypothetical protein
MLKKFRSLVFPGDWLTLATLPLAHIFMSEDLPAFERPAMATSLNLLSGKSFIFTALFINVIFAIKSPYYEMPDFSILRLIPDFGKRMSAICNTAGRQSKQAGRAFEMPVQKRKRCS